MISRYEDFIFETTGGLAVLTFSRNARFDDLDNQSSRRLFAALDEVNAGEEIKLLILTGRGK